MPTDLTSSPPELLVAGDRHWQWIRVDGDDGPTWRLRWRRTSDLERHLRFVEMTESTFFPLDAEQHSDVALEIEVGQARPLAELEWRDASTSTVVVLFESLGRWLRRLHDWVSPSGFGECDRKPPFHTFNAFMAAQFQLLSRRLPRVEDEVVRDTAVDALACLRNELSAFHPHGRSAWTVGRLTPHCIAVGRSPTTVIGILDFSTAALRPPEYDLASLRTHRLLAGHPIAERAFWTGYGAARTCDLERRITYFERLIELEHLLGCPAVLCAGSGDAQDQGKRQASRDPDQYATPAVLSGDPG